METMSVEFYTLAFVVAMAVVGYLISRNDKSAKSTHIVQLDTNLVTSTDNQNDILRLQPQRDGSILLTRCGLFIAEGETVNLVITIADDKCSIVEKKGIVKRRARAKQPITGSVTLTCLPTGGKLHVRYDSQITSRWVTFTFDPTKATTTIAELRY